MSSLWSRLGVAAVGLPLVLGITWVGGWWLFGFAAVVAVVGMHEYALMIRSLRPVVLAGYAGILLTLLGAEMGGFVWMVGGLMATIALAFAQYGISTTRQPATIAIGSTFLGVGWLAGGLGSLLLLRDLPEHARLAIFTILLAVFAADTAAYAVGRLVGRHKLSPAFSPGKTWEGFLAGTAAAVLVAFFALYSDRHHFLSIWQALVLGLAIAVAEALGDLFESAIKRDMYVKDSGRLLGGHGGVLDRIDSLLFAAIAGLFVIAAFRWP
ncbi:MAG: phosphatidate cytidylyltransferase [Gaiellaceae bacterium]